MFTQEKTYSFLKEERIHNLVYSNTAAIWIVSIAFPGNTIVEEIQGKRQGKIKKQKLTEFVLLMRKTLGKGKKQVSDA